MSARSLIRIRPYGTVARSDRSLISAPQSDAVGGALFHPGTDLAVALFPTMLVAPTDKLNIDAVTVPNYID